MATSSASGQDIPPDFVFLLNPDHHIQERLEGEKFFEFVESTLAVVAEFCNDLPSNLVELQVACALLPTNRLLVEIQTGPAELRLPLAKDITRRLRRLTVPSVEGGPVAFARRIRFEAAQESSCTFPFASFVHADEPIPLDEVLLEAGAVRLPAPTLWGKAKAFFTGKQKTASSKLELGGFAAALSRRTGVVVIASNGQVVVGSARQEPFTIVENETASEGFVLVKYANGASGMVDKLMLDYLRSREPEPTQTAFDDLLAKVSRVRVLEGGIAGGKPLGNVVLLDTAAESDLAELKQALAILDGPAGHCMCCGEPTLELLSSSSEPLAALGIHHGQSVRWAGWKDDAELLDGRRLLDWLAQRGVRGPLTEYLEGHEREVKGRTDWDRWLAAMPDCLKQLSPDVWQHVTKTSDLALVQASLSTAYPDLRKRTLAIFKWFGNGAGPWTGFPVYEQLAEQILLQWPVEELTDVLQNASLSEEELEGASRFFAGWAFANRDPADGVQLPPSINYSNMAAFLPDRSGEPASIPVALREQLLAHCQKCADEDKKRRAKSAFAA